MKNFEGYLKKKFGDNYVLLAGGSHKSLSDFAMANAYLPLSGGTMTGPIYFGLPSTNTTILAYNSDYPKFGIWYNEGEYDTMKLSASGNADTDAGADLCINGNGDGTVTIRGNTIIHSGNISLYIGTQATSISLTGCESNDITNVYNASSLITNIGGLAAIRHSIRFPWYNDVYEIGNIRGDSTDSRGFGITKGNSQAVFRVNDSGGWINESAIITAGNISSYIGSAKLLTVDNSIVYGSSGLQFAQAHPTNGAPVGTSSNTLQNPTYDWYSHLIMNHANSGGYYIDLAFNFHTDEIYFRRIVNGSSTSWRSIITSANISSYITSSGNSQFRYGDNGHTDSVRSSATGQYSRVLSDGFGVTDTNWTSTLILSNLGNRGVIYFNAGSQIGLHFTGSYIGVGTASPEWPLHVNGNLRIDNGWIRTAGSTGWYNDSYGGGWYMEDTYFIRTYNGKILHINVNTNNFAISGFNLAADFYNPDHVCIGLRSSTCSWYVGGHSDRNLYIGYRADSSVSSRAYDVGYPVYITPAGAIYTSSDRRLKKNILNILYKELEDLINNISLKKFTWKSSGKDSYGFIAQELKEIIPEAVDKDTEGIMHVSYNVAYAKIIAALIYKTKELQKEINDLKDLLSKVMNIIGKEDI